MLHRLLVSVAATVVLSACGQQVAVVPVLQHDQCQTIDAGLTRVEFADLAKIRGLTMIGMTSEPAAPQDDLTLIAISAGPKPTAGFGFVLNDSATLSERSLTVEVTAVEPAADALVPQILTHPCVVVGVPGTDATQLTVVDQKGRPLGAVALD